MASLATVAGRPDWIVINRQKTSGSPRIIGTFVLDSGVELAGNGSGDNFVVSDDGTKLYTYISSLSSYEFRVFDLTDAGIQFVSYHPFGSVLAGPSGLKYGGGNVLASNGNAIDGDTLVNVWDFPGNRPYLPDSLNDRLYQVESSGSSRTITARDLATGLPLNQDVTFDGFSGSVTDVTRFGFDGIAFTNTTDTVYLLRAAEFQGSERRGVLQNDTDADDDPLTARVIQDVEHGDLTFNEDGSFTYIPDNNFFGSDQFTYVANDGASDSEIATVTINVLDVDDPPVDVFYVSSKSNGYVDGIKYKDEDILRFDTADNTWSMFFDGSDVGLKKRDVDAFHILDDGSILVSLDRPLRLRGLGKIDDSDILRFIPTELGKRTRGEFEWFFDASDVELSRSGEDVDAIAFTPDGRLVVSTVGKFETQGVRGRGEDLIVFNDTSFGKVTAGSWELYFDGSTVSTNGFEGDPVKRVKNFSGAWIDPETGDIYLARKIRRRMSEVLRFIPLAPGATTAGEFVRYWSPNEFGFDHELDAISIPQEIPTTEDTEALDRVFASDFGDIKWDFLL